MTEQNDTVTTILASMKLARKAQLFAEKRIAVELAKLDDDDMKTSLEALSIIYMSGASKDEIYTQLEHNGISTKGMDILFAGEED